MNEAGHDRLAGVADGGAGAAPGDGACAVPEAALPVSLDYCTMRHLLALRGENVSVLCAAEPHSATVRDIDGGRISCVVKNGDGADVLHFTCTTAGQIVETLLPRDPACVACMVEVLVPTEAHRAVSRRLSGSEIACLRGLIVPGGGWKYVMFDGARYAVSTAQQRDYLACTITSEDGGSLIVGFYCCLPNGGMNFTEGREHMQFAYDFLSGYSSCLE